VPHVRVHEQAIDARQLAQPLIQLDVRDDAAGQHEVPKSRLPKVMSDVTGGNGLQYVLVCRGDIDFRKLRREHPREKHVVALEDLEVAVFDGESREQNIAQYCGIAVCRQANDLALVTARPRAVSRGDGFGEGSQRGGKLDAVQPFDMSLAADADAARQAGTIAI